MPVYQDGPGSALFAPVQLEGNVRLAELDQMDGISEAMAAVGEPLSMTT